MSPALLCSMKRELARSLVELPRDLLGLSLLRDDGLAAVGAAREADAVSDARRATRRAGLSLRAILAGATRPGGALVAGGGGSATTFLQSHKGASFRRSGGEFQGL